MQVMIRRMLGIKYNESFEDGIDRKKAHIKKQFCKQRISLCELERIFLDSGIKNGDTIIVHCAWRNCYMIDGSPASVIDLLLKVIGKDGNLLMPCYPVNPNDYNVDSDASAAGVLSEVMRHYQGAARSFFPKGTMCGIGLDAQRMIASHVKSEYQFDEHSPYYLAIRGYKARILLIGMGKHPHKITAFHCGSYDARIRNPKLQETYSKQCCSTIRKNGIITNFQYIDRIKGCTNNKRVFRKLFCKTKHKTISYKGLQVISYDGADAYRMALDYCLSGHNLYRYKYN